MLSGVTMGNQQPSFFQLYNFLNLHYTFYMKGRWCMIKEATEYPGYFYIPGYSLYVISKTGAIIQRVTGHPISYRQNTSGYFVCSLINDHQCRRQISRARLLCTTFKPIDDAPYLQVDHINCNKEDDRLENLEWVTAKENCQRASKNGLYKGARPVKVCNFNTKQVTIYPSIAEAARACGMTKDMMLYRLEINDGRVYPERNQYCFMDTSPNWAEIEDIECELAKFGTSKRVLLRSLHTGEVFEYDKLSDLAKALEIPLPSLSTYMSKRYQPVIPGLYQVKLKSDKAAWIDPVDPWLELAKITGTTPVVVTDAKTGKYCVYESQAQCARTHNLLFSTLNNRLKFGSPDTIYTDGFKYSYYSSNTKKEEGSTTSA